MNQLPSKFDQFFDKNAFSSNRRKFSNGTGMNSNRIPMPITSFPTMGTVAPDITVPTGAIIPSGSGFPIPSSFPPITSGSFQTFPVPPVTFPMQGTSIQPPTGGSIAPIESQAPTSAPPAQIPKKPVKAAGAGGVSTFLVEPDVMLPCRFKFTYVWLRNGASFWFYPVIFGRQSVGGFYWIPQFHRWGYYALDTRLIDVVSCV